MKTTQSDQSTLHHVLAEPAFENRHIGLPVAECERMLQSLGYNDMQAFIADVVPQSIFDNSPLELPAAQSETEVLQSLAELASRNQPMRSLIGQGYYGTVTPPVIARNILENPAWYTAYTPYQPEISQGRLEALLNFQTVINDLTGFDIANASMLDEGSAAAEAMALARRAAKNKSNTFFVDRDCFPQTIAVVRTRAEAAGYQVYVGDPDELTATDAPCDFFGVLLQYPGCSGELRDYRPLVERVHDSKALVVVAADIMALMLLASPAEMGADVAVGSTQRFGVPMGFGGPHAAYMATRSKYQRSLPGRLVGLSIDSQGQPAYRLALQTREQHIRREKATSNICTAQVLLAVIASMYACYHGPVGLKKIASKIFASTSLLRAGLVDLGFTIVNRFHFDTLTVISGEATTDIHARARNAGFNFCEIDEQTLAVSLDETVSSADVEQLWEIFSTEKKLQATDYLQCIESAPPTQFLRNDAVLTHPVFSRYHSETDMLRYLRKLADKDLALDRTMIPLGSCTMKLNATTEMLPITWPEFSNVHPFAPVSQVQGYHAMIAELEQMLVACTGYDAVSLQPNAGSQGEFAGLLAIAAYHRSRGEPDRNICLIPGSAHGTNPASAQMCGMKVVVVDCDAGGNVDLQDLTQKAEQHAGDLAALMVTYPSTHGVFEAHIREVADIVHRYGGQVYVDGANLNAMLGLCAPGEFGGDVSHLNLHKTFCIPHGGGGPGVGPVAAKSHLAPFLPTTLSDTNGSATDRPVVSSAAFGSASILPISWTYIRMMGDEGLRRASEVAILSANYIAHRLSPHYPVLYSGDKGLVAHECILDLRPLKEQTGIAVEDVAKRLIDYGFHAPTMSFPVPGTLMIEPTESESVLELDRFCDAMIAIRSEIEKVASGEWSLQDNPLVNAPHTAECLLVEKWPHAYSRELAAYPVPSLRDQKYWSPVGRVDNVYGDRNLVCACPSIDDYRD